MSTWSDVKQVLPVWLDGECVSTWSDVSCRFCLSRFTVGVWSTAGMGNLMPLLDRLLGQVRRDTKHYL